MHACTHECMQACLSVCLCCMSCMHVWMHSCMHACMYVSVWTHVCLQPNKFQGPLLSLSNMMLDVGWGDRLSGYIGFHRAGHKIRWDVGEACSRGQAHPPKRTEKTFFSLPTFATSVIELLDIIFEPKNLFLADCCRVNDRTIEAWLKTWKQDNIKTSRTSSTSQHKWYKHMIDWRYRWTWSRIY